VTMADSSWRADVGRSRDRRERRRVLCIGPPGGASTCGERPVWGVLVRRFDDLSRPWIEVLPVCADHLRPARSWRGVASHQVEIVPLATLRRGSRQALPEAWARLELRWRAG
jgi:hypothetical protein